MNGDQQTGSDLGDIVNQMMTIRAGVPRHREHCEYYDHPKALEE